MRSGRGVRASRPPLTSRCSRFRLAGCDSARLGRQLGLATAHSQTCNCLSASAAAAASGVGARGNALAAAHPSTQRKAARQFRNRVAAASGHPGPCGAALPAQHPPVARSSTSSSCGYLLSPREAPEAVCARTPDACVPVYEHVLWEL